MLRRVALLEGKLAAPSWANPTHAHTLVTFLEGVGIVRPFCSRGGKRTTAGMFPSRPRQGEAGESTHGARESAPQIDGKKRKDSTPHADRTVASTLRADSVSSPVGPAGLATDTSRTSLLLPDGKGTLSFSTKTLTGKTVSPHRRPTRAVRCRQRKAPRGEGLPLLEGQPRGNPFLSRAGWPGNET